MRSPADFARQVEERPVLPAGDSERVSGYRVMGLPFASGHVPRPAPLDGLVLGHPAPLAEQARMADFYFPQRGIMAVGRVFVTMPADTDVAVG